MQGLSLTLVMSAHVCVHERSAEAPDRCSCVFATLQTSLHWATIVTCHSFWHGCNTAARLVRHSGAGHLTLDA